jgi:hypothetical protein
MGHAPSCYPVDERGWAERADARARGGARAFVRSLCTPSLVLLIAGWRMPNARVPFLEIRGGCGARVSCSQFSHFIYFCARSHALETERSSSSLRTSQRSPAVDLRIWFTAPRSSERRHFYWRTVAFKRRPLHSERREFSQRQACILCHRRNHYVVITCHRNGIEGLG